MLNSFDMTLPSCFNNLEAIEELDGQGLVAICYRN